MIKLVPAIGLLAAALPAVVHAQAPGLLALNPARVGTIVNGVSPNLAPLAQGVATGGPSVGSGLKGSLNSVTALGVQVGGRTNDHSAISVGAPSALNQGAIAVLPR